jgi:hypothetical protein
MLLSIPVAIGAGIVENHGGAALSRAVAAVSGRDPAELIAMSIWSLLGGTFVAALTGVYLLQILAGASYSTRHFMGIGWLFALMAWTVLLFGTYPWLS